MRIARLTLDFHLGGCRSLKEKRQRLRGLRDRFGRVTNLAVSESGAQDSLRSGQWSFVAVADSGRVVEQTLAEVEHHARFNVDAELVGADRQWLD